MDVKHFPVIWQGDGYIFGQHKFNNLRKLLEHFENIPAIGKKDKFWRERITVYTTMGLMIGHNGTFGTTYRLQ